MVVRDEKDVQGRNVFGPVDVCSLKGLKKAGNRAGGRKGRIHGNRKPFGSEVKRRVSEPEHFAVTDAAEVGFLVRNRRRRLDALGFFGKGLGDLFPAGFRDSRTSGAAGEVVKRTVPVVFLRHHARKALAVKAAAELKRDMMHTCCCRNSRARAGNGSGKGEFQQAASGEVNKSGHGAENFSRKIGQTNSA